MVCVSTLLAAQVGIELALVSLYPGANGSHLWASSRTIPSFPEVLGDLDDAWGG